MIIKIIIIIIIITNKGYREEKERKTERAIMY